MQRLYNSEIGLRPERAVRIGGLAVVRIQFADDVEAVFRHHLLGSAPVVISQCEPRVVRRVGTVRIVRPLIRIRKECVIERVHRRIRHLRFLPCGFHSHVNACPVGRGQCHFRIDIISAVVVVDEHSVLVVEAEGDIVCAFSGAAAEREVVSLRERIAEQQVIPVRVHVPQ